LLDLFLPERQAGPAPTGHRQQEST